MTIFLCDCFCMTDFLCDCVAHFHHLREKLKEGMELKSALLQSGKLNICNTY